MEEIKRCPFCNGKANMHYVSASFDDDDMVYEYVAVICVDCGAMGPKCQTEEEAIEMWNRRA